MQAPAKNEFFDINKLSPEEGIIVFPISMSRISTSQTAEKCWEYLQHFNPEKIAAPLVGLNFLYTEGLYMNLDTNKSANNMKNSYAEAMLTHKNAFENIIKKHLTKEIQIPQAFFYMSWFQLYLSVKEFRSKFLALKKFAEEDDKLLSYLQEDADYAKKELTKEQINFFLEEHLVLMLLLKRLVKLPNDYILGREKWILNAYPGKPPKALAYLFQVNPLQLKGENNRYDATQYDLESKRLYEFGRLDLDSWNYA